MSIRGGASMSIEFPGPNEVFTIRVYKEYAGLEWANTYEFRAREDNPITYTQLLNAANTIAATEAVFHLSYVNFTRIVVSTYVPDSEPYNPSAFLTFYPVGLTGGRTIVGGLSEAMPLHVAVYARFNAVTGRSGRKFYRGVLTETDCAFSGSTYVLRTLAVQEVENPLNNLLANLSGIGQIVLARGTPVPVNVRAVTSVQVSNRAAIRQTRNRYFDIRE